MSKIQGKGVKNSTEIVASGATIADLITDDQIYASGNSINKTLKQAIIDGDIGGASAPSVFGTRLAPRPIVAASGISSASSHMSTTLKNQLVFIEGSVSGVNDISSSPQISAHTVVGAQLVLVGCNDSKSVLLEHGNGLVLNGSASMEADCVLTLWWNGSNWFEISRNF